jgi:hypothetical protein
MAAKRASGACRRTKRLTPAKPRRPALPSPGGARWRLARASQQVHKPKGAARTAQGCLRPQGDRRPRPLWRTHQVAWYQPATCLPRNLGARRCNRRAPSAAEATTTGSTPPLRPCGHHRRGARRRGAWLARPTLQRRPRHRDAARRRDRRALAAIRSRQIPESQRQVKAARLMAPAGIHARCGQYLTGGQKVLGEVNAMGGVLSAGCFKSETLRKL